jgi:transglutaminase-like putative cysteine protease
MLTPTLCLWTAIALTAADTPATTPWWDAAVENSLQRAPRRRGDWLKALEETPPAQRPGMSYLVTHLPLRDLETLRPEALADNVALAYQSRDEVPWGRSLPEDVFLDAVLPHASLTEPRAPMRAEFHARYIKLAGDCKSPGEAAQRINRTVFTDYSVKYNTRRIRTDQNSVETVAQGMATCTGLSILLVEACRAVGVPARVAGISSWPGRGGNHTWVEVWDGGWHFAGAAEPDDKGLDHAWFVADASKAIKDQPRNAIYAVTYRPTGEYFPLAWNARARVNAENVTDRYTRGNSPAPSPPRLMVEARLAGERVEADVVVFERSSGATRLTGKCSGPQADINHHLSTPASPDESFLVVVRHKGRSAVRAVSVKGDMLVRFDLDRSDTDAARSALSGLLEDRFGTDQEKAASAGTLLAELPLDDEARKLAWQAYKASPTHEPLRKEFDAKTVETKDRKSPYLWRHVGEKPKDGWALVIAMHGGGNTPKRVNDGQWDRMFKSYYKDHPEAGGYVHLALRAPNDTWNGFYDDAISPLVERLIRQFVLFGDVNPDKVYALGASHGGYGAFVIGPKMPDRFAAVHASASAPTDGETMGENLRNLRFTFMVGENDTAYGRAERCQSFAKQVQTWSAQSGGYPGWFEWRPGVGHSVPDRDKVGEMLWSGVRNPWPKRVVWVQSDDVLKHCYWVETPHPSDKGRIEASVHENTITLKADGLDEAALWLDDGLIAVGKPVTVVVVGGPTNEYAGKSTLENYCLGLEQRGDPRLAAPVRLRVRLTR